MKTIFPNLGSRAFLLCLTVLGVMVLGVSCSSPIASYQKKLGDACWNVTDTLEFSWENDGSHPALNLVAPFEFTEDYGFSNIYLWLSTRTPSGKEWNRPLEYVLLDPQGVWYGTGNGQRQFSLPLDLPKNFSETGTYVFRLTHHMQESRLCGVQSAGFELMK